MPAAHLAVPCVTGTDGNTFAVATTVVRLVEIQPVAVVLAAT